jgi:hypothetical protein
MSFQVSTLEQRIEELNLLAEEEGLFPDQHHQKMLEFLQERHFN